MIEQYKLYNDTSAITGDGGGASQSVNVFTFETLFDIKCLVQKAVSYTHLTLPTILLV